MRPNGRNCFGHSFADVWPVLMNNSRRGNRSPVSYTDSAAARSANQLQHRVDPERSRDPASSRDRGANDGYTSTRSDPELGKNEKVAYKTINAKVETVDTAPSYRQAFRKNAGV
jgi:putative SOS response-associated peptidase YedK